MVITLVFHSEKRLGFLMMYFIGPYFLLIGLLVLFKIFFFIEKTTISTFFASLPSATVYCLITVYYFPFMFLTNNV